MKKFLPVILFLLTVGIIFQPSFVYTENVGGNSTEINQLNDAIAAKKAKIKQLEESIAGYKTKIKQKRLESVSLSNQMAIIDNRVSQVELDIEATEEKLDSLELEIKSFELSIEDKEHTMDKQKVMLSELIRTIHYSDNKSYLEIAAAYDNFSDFYNQLQYVESIENDLGKSVQALRGVKEELEAKKEQTEERKGSYEDLKKELNEKRKNLEEQAGYKSTLLAQTQSSELTFQTLLNNLKSQYQQIENEVSAIEREVRRKLEASNKLNNISGDPTQLSWPTQSRYVTAYFHDPDYPYRHVFEHSGLDVRASHGTPLKATASGYVARAKHCSWASCYSYVMLVHSSGLSTVYGHMSSISVQEDQFVTRGDVIGYSGGTPGTVGAGPFVTGPHLHFEVRKNGIPVNPLNYLVQDW
jgi:murein DD-endopeptidase MepM/ murein hydrolase activator NlpD